MLQKAIGLLVALVLLISPLPAQPDSLSTARIDSLFSAWNRPDHPGGVVGIRQGDRLVYLKAFGLASLEYRVPNTTGTLFNTASVSKQFTAMGIVRLHQEGKLSVDDDLRKYVPELPDFGHTITIRHMLHHTSGLRSLHALLALAGWRDDDTRTNEDLYQLMARQRDLNFVPGDEYLYCNTGYMYMARIIEQVSGEPFPDWMKKNVFEPLGMDQTYVEDRYDRVVPQNATSYRGSADGGFSRAVEYWGYVGSGNMHSTVRDLLHWLSNFYHPRAGWEGSFALLQTVDPFNDGSENMYAFGVSTSPYRGLKRIGHGGSIGGFRSQVAVFPEKETAVAILTNFSSAGPGQKVNALADLLFPENEAQEESMSPVPPTVDLSPSALKAFEGSFWNQESLYARKIYVRKDTLRYFRSEENESALVPVSATEFRMLDVDGDFRVRFEGKPGRRKMIFLSNGEEEAVSAEYIPVDPSPEEWASYAGRYYSPELETTYILDWKDEKLTAYHPRHGEMNIRRIRKDVLEGEWPLGTLVFERNDAQRVIGLTASNGRVRHLRMEKVRTGK